MPKRILMVAYHFPPVRGSSGVHRTLLFSRYLAEDHGWEPTVLTVHPRAYESTSGDQLDDIAPGVEVIRSFALDTSRHLSLAGRYPRFLALPDRWMSWRRFAVRAATQAHRRRPFDVLWSTYPIATAHAIGATLRRRLRLPWIADFRDSMTEDAYPPDPVQREAYRVIERHTVESCARAVFTAPGAKKMYATRYPAVPPSRWTVIENGYDERAFQTVEPPRARSADGPKTLVHSGILYRSERDPSAFLDAIRILKQAREVDSSRLRVRLRASGDEAYHARTIRDRGIDDIVTLEAALPYREALAEMIAADGLLVFQASNCNHQIPAKAYEYIRAKRPIMAVTDTDGDTASLLRSVGGAMVVPIDDATAIADGVRKFLDKASRGSQPLPDGFMVRKHSRRERAAQLAGVLDDVMRIDQK